MSKIIVPKPDKGRLGHFFYPYQKDYLTDTSRFIYWVKARQIGGSFVMGYKAAWESLFLKQNNIFLSVSQRNARRIMKYVRQAVFSFETLLQQKIPLVLDNKDEIQFKDGGTIISLPNNPDTAIGESGNLNVDEVSRFKNSDQIQDAVIPFISRGHKLRMISTPLGKRGIFWRFNQDSLANPHEWSRHSVTVYEAIRQGCPIDIDSIKNKLDDISFRQNYLCEFLDDNIAFFGYELILKNIDYELENYTLDQLKKLRTPLIAGYDPGKIIDSGAFVLMTKNQQGKVVVLHMKEFIKTDYSEQIAYILQMVRSCGISKCYIDATGVGVKLFEDIQKQIGSIAAPITYTNAVKEQLVTTLKLFFEREKISIPDSTRLLDQLHGIEREVTIAGNTRYKHDEKAHDDLVMALCNALSHFSDSKSIDIKQVLVGSPSVFATL